MASDVGTSINVVQLLIELGAICISVGGLVFMVKNHSKKIDVLEKKMDEVRENWVTRPDLREELRSMEDRIVGKVLIAVGADRRVNARE